jgi:tripartite-type tricarboxylate transporter receptor subunit TctC
MGFKEFWVLLFVLAFASFSSAGEFPKKQIEILMPYGIGGYTPIAYRVVADIMSKHFSRPVILLPSEGAGGTLAGEKVAKRVNPDGYTLLQCNSATNVNALHIKKGVNYTMDDFIYLAEVCACDLALIAAPDAPFKTLEEYVAFARKNPNTIKHSSTGVGTSGHLCLELLKIKAGGLKIDLVPFKTQFDVEKAVLGGHCHSAFVYGGGGGPNDTIQKTIEGGGRVLAVTTKKRLEAWPEIPTFTEKGLDVVFSAWYGVAGPKALPNEVVLSLKNALYKAIQDPQVVKVVKSVGFRHEFRKNEEFTRFVKEYNTLVEMIVTEAKIPKN